MDWSSSRDIAKFSPAGIIAVLVSGILAELLLPDTGPLIVAKAVVPAAVGGAVGVYMIKNIAESNLTELEV